jgi:hypothetical protein
MRIRLFSLALALVLAAPLSAQPATTPPAAPIAPSHLAAAREYLELFRIVELGVAGAQMAMDQQIAANPELEPYRAAMLEWARDLFGGEEIRSAFAVIYAETFTEAEIRQLMDFARTPLGRKVAANQVSLTQRGAELGKRLAQEHQADLIARIEAVDAAPKPE